jgi:2-oxoglutarate dehydrogenase E1 component|tara:strand:+ start:4044 stop:6989 length:2946 start_codon:yes stop_codon:yes gene_type:complete
MSKLPDNKIFEKTSFLHGTNSAFIEQMYEKYLINPISVPADWQIFFSGINDKSAGDSRNASWSEYSKIKPNNGDLVSAIDGNWPEEVKLYENEVKSFTAFNSDEVTARSATLDSIRAIMMIRAYRIRGHLKANLDPLGLVKQNEHTELKPETYGFNSEDMDRQIFLDNVLGLEFATLKEILEILNRTYCSTVGIEFMHISDPEEKSWLQKRIEGKDKEITFTDLGKEFILKKLIEAEGFEKYLHKKFVGTKRFGLDGAETVIPAMEQIIKKGGQLGVSEIVIGMPHRGRLGILASVMGKAYQEIFHEFAGGSIMPEDVAGSGDVKYHLGTSSDRIFDDNKVHISLTANPSHLEAVDPVVLGRVRAKQAHLRTDKGKTIQESFTAVMPILLHGDAAFAGQGIVAECFALSGLRGHKTGGTIHIIVNNQIGFTTSPSFARSSPYPSDVAKFINAPILHVNGDDCEAVIYAARVATEFRQKFNKDVVLDVFCYRRFGHNEGDDPTFTQPLMYKKIKSHKSVADTYAEKVINEKLFDNNKVLNMKSDFIKHLDSEFEAAKSFKPNKADWLDGFWANMKSSRGSKRKIPTSISKSDFKNIGSKVTSYPESLNIHKTLARIFGNRKNMIDSGEGVDWATAEALAFGSLLEEGFPVRLVGQDSIRGTFSHRHSALVDQETEERYIPLNNISDKQARYEGIDSFLSEAAILGYEYGYSLDYPSALVLWEAQFGDFANGAQVQIDQFIAPGEAKWLRMSGLVLLLPHGYEGQGPEHSSARIERYLQLCAEENMIVANCTTPANYFHILRRQLLRDFRKPLIMFTPKSLLRHKQCTSKIEDFTDDTFHRVLLDDGETKDREQSLNEDDKIKKVILCSGKVYYDLTLERDNSKKLDIYIIRLEQLYPFPAKALTPIISRFKNADFVWCQEEPKNMGPWNTMERYINWCLTKARCQKNKIKYVGRSPAASTATGLMSKHQKQQKMLIDSALSV